MSDAPEKIWLLWSDNIVNGRYSASSLDHSEESGFPEYVRADRIAALEAQIAAADRLADVVMGGSTRNVMERYATAYRAARAQPMKEKE